MLNNIKLMKKILYAASIVLAMMVSSCNCDDPNNAAPDDLPVVKVTPSTITGRVIDSKGQPVAGADVTFGTEKGKTDASGVYVFTLKNQGLTKISASYNGMVTAFDEIDVPDFTAASYTLNWNAILYKEVREVANVTGGQQASAELETESVPGNTQGEVNITVDVPAEAVEVPEGEEQVEIYLAPMYDQKQAQDQEAASRAATSKFTDLYLIGATLSSNNKNAKLKQPLNLTFDLDESCRGVVVPRMFTNGKWVDLKQGSGANQYEYTTTGLLIRAKNFTSYGVFVVAEETQVTYSTPVTITPQSVFDNFYGNKDIKVGSVRYLAKMGAELNAKQAKNKLQGLMLEYVARTYGNGFEEIDVEYPLNVTLPAGSRLTVNGSQEAHDVIMRAGQQQVTCATYGDIKIQVDVEARPHNGGGSN